MSILWVTSFNKSLYEATGRHLINTFENYTSDKLLIGGEDLDAAIFTSRRIFYYDLKKSKLLTTWLKTHEDIIPLTLGGKASPCNCPDPYARSERDHKKGCYHTWFNRNMSRWFRKIATLHFALLGINQGKSLGIDNNKYLIWIDSDCEFLRPTSFDFIDNIAKDYDVCFMKSKKRRVMEAGFIIYNLEKNGGVFLEKLFKYYMYDFLHLIRWDDSYVIQKLLFTKDFKSLDIAFDTSGHNDVIMHSLVGKHIMHHKGTHGRKLGLMK